MFNFNVNGIQFKGIKADTMSEAIQKANNFLALTKYTYEVVTNFDVIQLYKRNKLVA